MIIHGSPPSPFARKVLIVCEEKGLAYESRDLIPFPKTPELLAKNPLGLIPIAEVEEGVFLPDSSVICAYLERMAPDPTLLPGDALSAARALFIEEYCDTRLNDAIAPIFFQRFVQVQIFGQSPDESAVQAGIIATAEAFDQVEGLIPDRPGPLLESGFSVADAAFASQLGSLELAGEKIDAARWPRIAAYADWVSGRPSVQRVRGLLA